MYILENTQSNIGHDGLEMWLFYTAITESKADFFCSELLVNWLGTLYNTSFAVKSIVLAICHHFHSYDGSS